MPQDLPGFHELRHMCQQARILCKATGQPGFNGADPGEAFRARAIAGPRPGARIPFPSLHAMAVRPQLLVEDPDDRPYVWDLSRRCC